MTFNIKKYLLPATIIGAFLFLPLLMTLSLGVCCYDDASFAVVAKNFAHGLGYTLTLNYQGADFSGSAFDPALGQGPVGILPVALAIWLFGAHPITPGLTQIIMEFFLLLLISKFLLASFSVKRVSALLFVSLTLISIISKLHYAHWYAMLGESISALLLICAYAIWNSPERSKKHIILTGIFLSFAVLTKEISAIFVIAFMMFAISRCFFSNQDQTKLTPRSLLLLSFSGILPFLMFEFCRLYTLGWQGTISNWRAHIAFIKNQTPDRSIPFSILDQYQIRSQLSESNFFIGLSIFLLIAIFAIILLKKPLKSRNADFIFPIGLGIFLYFLYWTFLSSGPARYLYIAVLIWCFFISLPILTHKNLLKACLPALCCLVFIPASSTKFFSQIIIENNALAVKSKTSTANLPELNALNYLNVNMPGEKIFTPWWSHVAALEYLSPQSARFNGGAFAEKRPQSTIIINWDIAKAFDGLDKTNQQLSANNCLQVFSSERYGVFRCTGTSSHKPDFTRNRTSIITNQQCDGNLEIINGSSHFTSLSMTAKQLLNVNGWLTVSTDSSGKIAYISTDPNERPDLASHFKKAILNSAGFSTYAEVANLHGKYTIGLAWRYQNSINICSQFNVPIIIN
jgi:hypothetical protein